MAASTVTIGVLVPPYDADPGRPEDRPIGRAALQLEASGVAVVFAHQAQHARLTGVRARPGRWEAVTDVGVAAAYDRYPSQSRAAEYAVLRQGLGAVPVANPASLVLHCRDKLATQATLEAAGLPMPTLEADPTRFDERVSAWGAAFLKPRYGAFGRGVQRVVPGDPLPATGEGAVRGVEEPLFLQRAVPPPEGWAGLTCRVLVQRTGADAWHVEVPVARRSRTDAVVNAARGADVVSLEAFVPAAVEPARALAAATARALAALPDGELLVEVGVDVALDRAHQPWCIEVNSRPRGRLEALAGVDADRWWAAHIAACARPLEYLVALVAG